MGSLDKMMQSADKKIPADGPATEKDRPARLVEKRIHKPLAPCPRYRLYSYARSYLLPLGDMLTGRIHKGNDVARFERALAERFAVKMLLLCPRHEWVSTSSSRR
jgi:hypothetical protein